MRKAQSAYEANDFDAVNRNLQLFRNLVDQRKVPEEITLVAADLAFRTALAELRSAHYKPVPLPIADSVFDPLWKSVDQHTFELVGILGPSVQRNLEKGQKNSAVMAIARQQHLYLDRVAILQSLQRYVHALTELNEVDRLRELHEEIANEEIIVEGRASQGIGRTKRKRGDVFNFYGHTAIQSDRIRLLGLWRLRVPDDASITNSLVEAYTEFVDANPGHELSYNYVWSGMELSGKLDLDALKQTLDATSDKGSRQFASNQVSLGNSLLEAKHLNEALSLYESALKSEQCPPDRLAEIYYQLAHIHSDQGRADKAIEFYKLSKSLTDRFQATDMLLTQLEKPKPVVQANRRLWLFGLWVSHAIVATVAIMIWKRRHRPTAPLRRDQ